MSQIDLLEIGIQFENGLWGIYPKTITEPSGHTIAGQYEISGPSRTTLLLYGGS